MRSPFAWRSTTIDRFADERSFFSYCRLVPGANNSGDRVKHKRSREGNRYLKMTFGNAAVRAVQYYPEIRSWYLRKKRRKGERIAKALVAKEIARIVFYVWKKDEDFNGRFKGSVLERVKQEWWHVWPLLRSPNSLTDCGRAIVRTRNRLNGPALEWERSKRATELDLGLRKRSTAGSASDPVWGFGQPAALVSSCD